MTLPYFSALSTNGSSNDHTSIKTKGKEKHAYVKLIRVIHSVVVPARNFALELKPRPPKSA